MTYLIIVLFFGIPIATIAYFMVSLCRFLSARKQNKLQPSMANEATCEMCKKKMILALIMMVVIVAAFVTFCVQLMYSIKYM